MTDDYERCEEKEISLIMITNVIAKECGVPHPLLEMIVTPKGKILNVIEDIKGDVDIREILAFLVFIRDWNNVDNICHGRPVTHYKWSAEVKDEDFIQELSIKPDGITSLEDLKEYYTSFCEDQKVIREKSEIWSKNTNLMQVFAKLESGIIQI